MCLINSLLCREARDEFEFVTAENTLPRIKKGVLVNEVVAVKMKG